MRRPHPMKRHTVKTHPGWVRFLVYNRRIASLPGGTGDHLGGFHRTPPCGKEFPTQIILPIWGMAERLIGRRSPHQLAVHSSILSAKYIMELCQNIFVHLLRVVNISLRLSRIMLPGVHFLPGALHQPDIAILQAGLGELRLGVRAGVLADQAVLDAIRQVQHGYHGQ
jgi:hypothetical protein